MSDDVDHAFRRPRMADAAALLMVLASTLVLDTGTTETVRALPRPETERAGQDVLVVAFRE